MTFMTLNFHDLELPTLPLISLVIFNVLYDLECPFVALILFCDLESHPNLEFFMSRL